MQRDLPGYERASFEHRGRVHEVYRAGTGPGVVVVHEVPGIHPEVLVLAGRLRDEGFTVVLPSLFGHPGAPATGREVARSIARICVGREFYLLANRTSPVVGWLRALAVDVHRDCGGAGVGAWACASRGAWRSPWPSRVRSSPLSSASRACLHP